MVRFPTLIAFLFASAAAFNAPYTISKSRHVPQRKMSTVGIRNLPALQPKASSSRAVVRMQEDDEKMTSVPFELRLPLGDLVVGAGILVTLYSFVQFFVNAGDSTSAIGFVYGFPIGLLGLSLKYAEVPPVPLETSPAAGRISETAANPTIKQIKSDVTRFRYADQHLEDALNVLKLRPSGEGPPELQLVKEDVTEDGQYYFEMQFFSNKTPYNSWLDRAPRFATFFGPNVRAEIRKLNPKEKLVGLRLVTLKEGESADPLEIQEDGTVVNLQVKAISPQAAAP